MEGKLQVCLLVCLFARYNSPSSPRTTTKNILRTRSANGCSINILFSDALSAHRRLLHGLKGCRVGLNAAVYEIL